MSIENILRENGLHVFLKNPTISGGAIVNGEVDGDMQVGGQVDLTNTSKVESAGQVIIDENNANHGLLFRISDQRYCNMRYYSSATGIQPNPFAALNPSFLLEFSYGPSQGVRGGFAAINFRMARIGGMVMATQYNEVAIPNPGFLMLQTRLPVGGGDPLPTFADATCVYLNLASNDFPSLEYFIPTANNYALIPVPGIYINSAGNQYPNALFLQVVPPSEYNPTNGGFRLCTSIRDDGDVEFQTLFAAGTSVILMAGFSFTYTVDFS